MVVLPWVDSRRLQNLGGTDGRNGQRMKGKASTRKRRLAIVAIALGALVALPTLALGHIERASYWPNPGADTSVHPAAGGAIPDIRPLATALDAGQPGVTRVVCKGTYVAQPQLKSLK